MTYRKLISFVWQYIRQQPIPYLFIFLLSFTWAVDATVWPYLIGYLIDKVSTFNEARTTAITTLALPAIFAICLGFFIRSCFGIQGLLLAKAQPKLEADIRMTMFNHVQRHSPQYFNDHFAGSLSNKISDMTSQIEFLLRLLLTTFIPAGAACVIGMLFFFFINPFFAYLIAGWYLIHFLICLSFVSKCANYEHIHGEARSSLVGKLVDSFTNNFAVNLFCRFDYERKLLATLQKDEQQKNYRAKRYAEFLRIALTIEAFFIGSVGIPGIAIYFWVHEKITTGELVQIIGTSDSILLVIWIAGLSLPSFFQGIGITQQAFSIMDDPQDIQDDSYAKSLTVSEGEVEFVNVSFQYNEKRLFTNKSVLIKAKERIGLVGYSGAGKSTFVNLILRFYQIEKGKILIDGQDISKVTLESLRKQILLIPQDPILFHRTLKENIQYGNLNATDEEVINASKLAHCHEFIQQCPHQYQSIVGERGTNLSVGERQRIAIARAMLSEAKILILDEATSALDSITENFIHQSLETLMQDHTTIVIAHRLSTLVKMNRILVFNHGEIIEEGTHTDLLAKKGHYARMWHMQAGGFLPATPPA